MRRLMHRVDVALRREKKFSTGARYVFRPTFTLFGLCSVVAVLYHELTEGRRVLAVHWPGKDDVTFSDAITAVPRRLWSEWGFAHADGSGTIENLPAPLRDPGFSCLSSRACAIPDRISRA